MSLLNDLTSDVGQILATKWKERDGSVVPAPADVTLGNDAVRLKATVLYADLAESTDLVGSKTATFAAEIYKAYLRCAARVIQEHEGEITAYDGDRIMAVFLGRTPNTSAATAALKINYCVLKIINPLIPQYYTGSTYQVRHGVGIDTSPVLVAKTGIRGDNDLVWVGRSANYAAKLCALRQDGYSSWITKDVYDGMNDDAKYGGSPRQLMWEERIWNKYGITVYCSNWHWSV